MGRRTIPKNTWASRSRHRLFNWLKWLDRKARKLPRAKNWLNYPYFKFERYPRLRPLRKGKDTKSRLHLEGGYEAFDERLGVWETRIESHQKARRALQGLNKAQRRQVAALVVDSVCDVDEYAERRKWHGRWREIARGLPNRQQMRQRRLDRLRTTLKRQVQYERRLDPLLSRGLYRATNHALRELPTKVPEAPDVASHLADPRHPKPTNPVRPLMVRLYWLFRHGCHLSDDESQVRAGLIRNAFWASYGIVQVAIREEYSRGQSKGCDAVQVAVRNFHVGIID